MVKRGSASDLLKSDENKEINKYKVEKLKTALKQKLQTLASSLNDTQKELDQEETDFINEKLSVIFKFNQVIAENIVQEGEDGAQFDQESEETEAIFANDK